MEFLGAAISLGAAAMGLVYSDILSYGAPGVRGTEFISVLARFSDAA